MLIHTLYSRPSSSTATKIVEQIHHHDLAKFRLHECSKSLFQILMIFLIFFFDLSFVIATLQTRIRKQKSTLNNCTGVIDIHFESIDLARVRVEVALLLQKILLVDSKLAIL